jgi:hypothetical protein
VGRDAAGFSINKADLLCGSGAGGHGSGAPCSARHGDEEEGGFEDLGCWRLDLQQGSRDASPGSSLTTADPPLFFQVDGRPLPPLASVTAASSGRRQVVHFNLQAIMLFRRPLGSSAACSRFLVPSGVVPGDMEVGGAGLQTRCGGEGAGLDCFFSISFEVLSAKCQGVFVILCFFRPFL